jgi:hypothetical protein
MARNQTSKNVLLRLEADICLARACGKIDLFASPHNMLKCGLMAVDGESWRCVWSTNGTFLSKSRYSGSGPHVLLGGEAISLVLNQYCIIENFRRSSIPGSSFAIKELV